MKYTSKNKNYLSRLGERQGYGFAREADRHGAIIRLNLRRKTRDPFKAAY